MRTYEALYIVQPTLGDDEIQTVAQGVEKLVTDNGGAIVRSEIWGKRRLAYLVKKFQEGVYVLLRFESPPDVVKKMREHFRLKDEVIRHIVVHFDEHTLRLEAEQEKRNQALQAARGATGYGRGRDDEDEEDRPRRRESARREERPAAERPAPAATPAETASESPAEEAKPAEETKPAEEAKPESGAAESEASESEETKSETTADV